MSIAAAGACIVAAAAVRTFFGASLAPWDMIVELIAAGVCLGTAAWSLTELARGIRVASEVCTQAFLGNLETRILSERDQGNLGILQKSINDMLDIVDAFVRESAASMEYVSRAVEDAVRTNKFIQSLAEAGQRIGDVVDLISQIASQTNLLALNATIEAARAGKWARDLQSSRRKSRNWPSSHYRVTCGG